ncbi:MAG TPA: carboxypeptidase-like regulatory domain-containing protein [Candidatus Acidoferrales bacterium]|nr:carboxypeptidase-like regulatory domain-containing protein [Candidatus Acidoferrales bacterium]
MKLRANGYLLATLCVVVALLTAIPNAWGQASTSLRGTISDPSGAAIPSATVRLTNAGTNLGRTATTDQQGNYVFQQVLPGNYDLDVEASGFAKYHQTGIQLLVNLPATIDVKMKIGQSAETVTVTEQAPLLNTTDASIGQTMDKGGRAWSHRIPLAGLKCLSEKRRREMEVCLVQRLGK